MKMNEFLTHRLLENEEQQTIYFKIVSLINDIAYHPENPSGFKDIMPAVVGAAAVFSYHGMKSLGINEFTPEAREELIKKFSDTLDACNSDKTFKQFEPH